MPRASLTDRQVAVTRQRLAAAALSLYKREGPDAVTLRRLAAVMGTSHTQPYRYFASKQALFAAVRLECYRRFAELIRARDVGGADPAARLAAIHDGVMQFAADQPPLTDHPDLLRVRREAFDHLVSVVQDAVDRGLLAGDARAIMHVGWSAVHGLLNLHTAGQLVHGRQLADLVTPVLHTVFHPLFAGADRCRDIA